MVNRVYGNSLRPVVIIPSFQDINEDKENGQPKFAVFDIVLGVIYTAACVVEVFGVIAAATQRLALIRIYAILSTIASVLFVGAGFLRVVIHFAFKNGLLDECEKVTQGEGVEFRFGIWGPRVKDRLTHDEAVQFCSNAWNRDSLNEIIFLIFEILFAIFFTIISWAYYHQARDPTSAANVQRAPAGPGAYPEHYNRPYDAEGYAPSYATNNAGPYQPSYAPPPGPPPADMGYGVGMGAKDRDFKDNDSEVTKFDDPFADFEGPSKSKDAGTPPLH
ncbi:hypothetical protein K466DRAFT_539634 [Polyporus arcularius HHB13444]|uniref:Uncharacterized protein n=1 Tax=Polyporus arcularius HHB13444 TaxID=1314778 RepID=A0A5C3PSH9_9APHY|nr:hypothetical protein K466DRAFT_539634 [Polyporus arcularius HHB13444]